MRMDGTMSGDTSTMSEERYDALLDARGLDCPIPLLKARQALMLMESGKTLCVLATDPASRRDFEDYAEASGNELLDVREAGGVFTLIVQKR